MRARRGDASPSAYELALARGAAGERRFGNALNEAAALRGECWVLHGLVLEGKRADIDHLVIGPAGVTAIDSKTWEGRVWAGRVGLGRGARAYPTEIDGMSRQINRVHARLATAGRDDIPVEGLLCMVNENAGIPSRGFEEIRGIKVGHPESVIDHALRDGRFDLHTIEIVARLLTAAFVVHGGSQPPTEGQRRSLPRKAPHRRRAMRPQRLARRAALGVLAAVVAIAGIAALVSGVDASRDRLTRPYRAFSRTDLMSHEATYRRIAVTRAHGRVRGPKVRDSSAFVLVYRRASHCKVVVEVSRAAPIFGGGRPTRVRTTGCARRR
jgi:hypothetical protein